MDPLLPSITPEMRSALAASGGAPIHVQDPETLQVYVVSEQSTPISLDERYVQEKIDEGLAAIEAGDVVSWDPKRVKALGRDRLAARRASE